MEVVAAIIGAVGSAAAAIIGALAFLRKASVPASHSVMALRSLWDWVETKGYAAEVPERMRRAVLKILEPEEEPE